MQKVALVYGNMIEVAGQYALDTDAASNEERFLLTEIDYLPFRDLEPGNNPFLRFQALPVYSELKVGREKFAGTIVSNSLKRAQDLQGQVQLIREALHRIIRNGHHLDLALFDGKCGWIVGCRPHVRVYYDVMLNNWLCPRKEIQETLDHALGQRRRYVSHR